MRMSTRRIPEVAACERRLVGDVHDDVDVAGDVERDHPDAIPP
jgi:hypothetical protein